MKKRSMTRSILAAELVLLVPLIAMQFTEEVDWNVYDFAIVGVLLAGAGVAAHYVVNGAKDRNMRRVVVGFVLAAAIFLLWAELSVGIFGSPFAGS